MVGVGDLIRLICGPKIIAAQEISICLPSHLVTKTFAGSKFPTVFFFADTTLCSQFPWYSNGILTSVSFPILVLYTSGNQFRHAFSLIFCGTKYLHSQFVACVLGSPLLTMSKWVILGPPKHATCQSTKTYRFPYMFAGGTFQFVSLLQIVQRRL